MKNTSDMKKYRWAASVDVHEHLVTNYDANGNAVVQQRRTVDYTEAKRFARETPYSVVTHLSYDGTVLGDEHYTPKHPVAS